MPCARMDIVASMSTKPNVSSEPLTYGMTGFKVDDLVSPKFLAEMKKEFPTAIATFVIFGFADSKEGVAVFHDRDHDTGKFNIERVDVEGSGPDISAKVRDILIRVFS
jgi:hypothetical protein